MCTAVFTDGLFGRTLDLEYSYDECVTVVPGNFDLNIEGVPPKHLRFVGMAHVADGYPLMYDGMNELGLCAAALNFPGCAVYNEPQAGKRNIASYELLPLVLSGCGRVSQAAELLKNVNITGKAFSPEYPPTPLHWMIADKHGAVVVEQTSVGLAVHENRPGVMTNSPAFPEQLRKLADHMHISPCAPVNAIAPSTALPEYTRGMGALGLPGDFSSGSRFVRAAFAANNSRTGTEHEAGLVRFFHIMDMLGVPRGLCRLKDGKSVITVYTSCCDMERGEYLFTTYGCRAVRGVRLQGCDPDSDKLTMFPAAMDEAVMYLN